MDANPILDNILEDEIFQSEIPQFTPVEEFTNFSTGLGGETRTSDVGSYLVFVGEDALPDLTSDPYASGFALPLQISYPLGATVDLKVIIREVDSYGCVSQNQWPYEIKLTPTGVIRSDIAEPLEVFVYARHDSKIRVLAQYPTLDIEPDPADKIVVWVDTPNTDPPTYSDDITYNHIKIDFGSFLPGTHNVEVGFYRSIDARYSPSVLRSLEIPELPEEPEIVQ